MKAHCANAQIIAERLKSSRSIGRVHFPGLPDHPGHGIAKEQMRGFGGMLSFDVEGGLESVRRIVSKVRVFQYAESLGGVESLLGHPASMSHASMPPEERARRGIGDGLLRLSIGIEDPEDLWEDLEQAVN
jgi:cystathionine beta-lyase/cystathionine gamma-synthase